MAYIISADEIKKSLSGYDPAHSEDFHRESARLADREFHEAVKHRSEGHVVLMSGGAASGKSEYVSVYLRDANAIILDGTLPTVEGARIKIRNAQKCGKRVSVTAVMPESLSIAFSAFLGRDRKFSLEHFFRTHSSSHKTLLELAREFPSLEIAIIDSAYQEAGSMGFTEIVFRDRDQMVELLQRRQYTEEQIRNTVIHNAA